MGLGPLDSAYNPLELVVPDYGNWMLVYRESVLLPNRISAHNEGVLGTSLRRQVEERPYERSH